MKPTDSQMFNRTGMATSPRFAQELVEGAAKSQPSSTGDDAEIGKVRASYQKDAPIVGSRPAQEKPSAQIALLMDKLGERAAFERTGTRLYDVLIQKHRTEGIKKVPTQAELDHIRREELAHFELVRSAIIALGGDPSVETPAADLSGVASKGIGQVLADPRTTFNQCLQAILLAELADNDGWTLLISVAQAAGAGDLANKCERALKEEQEHLENVRKWLKERTLLERTSSPAGANVAP